MKFCRVIKFNKGKGKVCCYAISCIFDSEFLNYFPYVNLLSIDFLWVEIIRKNFRNTKCISGLKSFAGRGGGCVIYLGILSNMKIFRKSFTQDDKV